MIQHATFLGIPLRTLAHRRALVVGFYCFIAGLAVLPITHGKPLGGVFLIQTVMLGTIFGGVKAGGPVKSFAETPPPGECELITTLHLDARPTPTRTWLLDERERIQRDRAHYTAYRLLMLVLALGLSVAAIVRGLSGAAPAFLEHNALTLLWLLVVVGLSLPPSVILWTEPEPLPEAGLHLVRS